MILSQSAQVGNSSPLAKKTIPSLDEAAIQTELIEFQTSRQIRDVLRSVESWCVFWVACSEEYNVWNDLHMQVVIFLYERNRNSGQEPAST